MIGATKRWFRRNRRGLAIGAGVIGAGYMAGQYVVNKIFETRERMSSDRIARENLRRRFEQNQTDCTYTVLALLPTATDGIVDALPVEQLTKELQRKRAERLARLNAGGEATGSELSSVSPSLLGDDGKSLSSEGFVHASQTAEALGEGAGAAATGLDGQQQAPLTEQQPESEQQSEQQQQQQPPPQPQQPQVKRNKTQLWNEVKISSITRAFTLIYTLSLLTIFTRIQLNLLGRRSYISSVISLATPANEDTIRLEDNDDDDLTHTLGDDLETNRRYLAFSWWLLHPGWKKLMDRVQEVVTEVFGSLNPREDISLSKLSELTVQFRMEMEGSTEEDRRFRSWLSYLLPPREEEEELLPKTGVLGVTGDTSPQTSSALRHLLDETADLIESPSFSHVLTLLNNEAFSTLIEKKCATDAFKSPMDPATVQSLPSLASVPEPKTKLANVLAVMARQAHVIGNGANPPNEYLTVMEQNVRQLEAFAAVIYSSNLNLEIPGSDAKDGSGAPLMADPDSPPVMVNLDEDQSIPSPVAADQDPASAFEKAWGKAVDEDEKQPLNEQR